MRKIIAQMLNNFLFFLMNKMNKYWVVAKQWTTLPRSAKYLKIYIVGLKYSISSYVDDRSRPMQEFFTRAAVEELVLFSL